MVQTKILPTITTTEPFKGGTSWRDKIKELRRLKIEEVSLFLTVLEKDERQELYNLLEKESIKRIPHVHLRNDMTNEELDYLVSRHKTEVFNTHPRRQYPPIYDWNKHLKNIYIENAKTIPEREELEVFGGICLDFSHWEEAVLKKRQDYNSFIDLITSFSVGCGHLSAISVNSNLGLEDKLSCHYAENPSQLDYFEKYLSYAPPVISLELNNSLAEQLEIKKYIEINILRNYD